MMKETIAVLALTLLSCLTQPAMAHTQPSPMNDQNDLELLIHGWTLPNGSLPLSWTNNTPACQWYGVVCTNGIVTQLDWQGLGLQGFFNGSNLPKGLTAGDFFRNALTGTPILTSLPANLLLLDLAQNGFTGTPDLTSLPASLQFLFLLHNNLTGTPNLTSLPANMQNLDLGSNGFTGTPILSSLPVNLLSLALNNNQFSGTPDLSSLPVILEELNLYTNKFCGSALVDISCQRVYVDGTCSAGIATFNLPCDTMQ